MLWQEDSWSDVDFWVRELNYYLSTELDNGMPVLFVGNKKDLVDKRDEEQKTVNFRQVPLTHLHVYNDYHSGTTFYTQIRRCYDSHMIYICILYLKEKLQWSSLAVHSSVYRYWYACSHDAHVKVLSIVKFSTVFLLFSKAPGTK